ncbi:hypothetical protein DXG01_000104 [Tephrocybe rancida]|nr:hypothetical protein DXG01_000104 [Tephrocybe rancida]
MSNIESVLTDIPFFCVGLMTFGIFTFVLILKRVNIVALYLYASSFLAFIAGILDLGHILTESKPVVVNGFVRDAPSGLVTTREVALALSVGLLYIFLWHLVAQCPRNERRSEYDDKFYGDRRTPTTHSASWRRWGFLGIILQWSLLGLSVALSALQIVWRISSFNVMFTIYITEAIMEIVVSALFILKILLNMFISRGTPWWWSLQSNLTPLIALGISTGLGLGNLLTPLFSETTLGRFLRAVEMYILILFVLITTFYTNHADSQRADTLGPLRIEEGRAFTQPHSEKPVDPIDPTLRTAARPPVNQSWGANANVLRNHSSSSGPVGPSVVTWLVPRTEQRDTVWSNLTEDRELGPFTTTTPASSSQPTPNPPLQTPPIDTKTTPTSIERRSVTEPVLPKDKHLTSVSAVSAVSISSYYEMDQPTSSEALPPPLPPAITVSRETESPVYGLDGIARSRAQPKHRPQSSMSFNELLRQQTELDKSIAALRLYAADDSSTLVTSSQPASRDSFIPRAPNLRTGSVSTNSYLGWKPESASHQSDFSLSIFPQPPSTDPDGLPNSVKLERLVGRARTLRLEPIAPRSAEVDIAIKVDEGSSLPVSPNQFEGTARMESAGTQYDVTSFIGGLTLPGRGSGLTTGSVVGPTSGLATAGSSLSAVESEDETSPSAAATRPMILTTSPMVAQSDINTKERPRQFLTPKRAPAPLRPLLLGRATAGEDIDVMVMGTSSKVPIGPRKRLRREISVPSLPRDEGDHAPGAFERPRTPPLLTNTATQDEIRQAYRKESLRTHPDRLPNATPFERQRATESFQALADAYYVLSDPARRREYDSIYASRPPNDRTGDPNSSSSFFSKFSGIFTGSGPQQNSQPNAENVFADVFDELLRPEVDRHVPWWSYMGAVCGGGIGFIVANVPGFMLGAYAGNKLGAVRDAKGKSVAAVFNELGGSQKAEILRALAMKVLGSAL